MTRYCKNPFDPEPLTHSGESVREGYVVLGTEMEIGDIVRRFMTVQRLR